MKRLIFIVVAFVFAFTSECFAADIVGELRGDGLHKKVRVSFKKDKTGLVFTQMPRYKLEIAYTDIDSVKFGYVEKGFNMGTALMGGAAVAFIKKGDQIPAIILHTKEQVFYLSKFGKEKDAQRFWQNYFPHRSKIKVVDIEKWKEN